MANLKVSWPPNPPDEKVVGYDVFMNGAKVATVSDPVYLAESISPGVYAFSVTPISPVWGPGPASDEVVTPPPASRIPSVSFEVIL